ncbi:MAG: sigma-54-dependent Fis family transcriptional regulator [Deltaproteobacteria bacterium]|nr:sigma-54-dependent Fis family transcriptional regulator [Deltaproteobacteria bacterium]MCW5804467.1 sigma-54-dependent Fis family transcriptional regulator [Deltaproteobacteria bacterium]
MTARTVLIADDHVEMARLVADRLREDGWRGRVVDSGRAAIDALGQAVPDLVITDLRMAEVDGLDVLDAARAADPDLPVIIMTAFGAIDSAIESMKRGAWHYLAKPVRLEELSLQASRAFEHRTLRRVNRQLRGEGRTGLGNMIGKSGSMRALYGLIDRVALASAPVLIRGESGSGKELVARALHDAGPRRERPFLAINCTALPEALLESELFGHTRGAFTGAVSARAGLFVEASGGTLFLDEIGDMAPALQAKLLRVVQQGEVRPVGSDESRAVDVRVIAATHQDLEARVADGRFRQDLFYRLDVVPMTVPPLRERTDDVPLLVDYFLATARARNPHSPVREVTPQVMSLLSRYPWPGNVRELENLIERLVVVGTEPAVGLAELGALAPAVTGNQDRFSLPRDRLATLREVEEEYIAWMIEKCAGNKTKAAEILGIDPSTLHRRTRRR